MLIFLNKHKNNSFAQMCLNDIQVLETRRKEILSIEILTIVPLKVLKSLVT